MEEGGFPSWFISDNYCKRFSHVRIRNDAADKFTVNSTEFSTGITPTLLKGLPENCLFFLRKKKKRHKQALPNKWSFLLCHFFSLRCTLTYIRHTRAHKTINISHIILPRSRLKNTLYSNVNVISYTDLPSLKKKKKGNH